MKNSIFASAVSVILCASSASAVTFSGTASGEWSNPVGTTGFTIGNNDGGGTADVNWGTPTTGLDNLWSFDGTGSDGGVGWSTSAGSLFSFGDFTYRNGSVSGHDFEGADLSVTLSILAPLLSSTIYDFEFIVNNVPNNSGDPVTDGDIADIGGTVSSQSFNFGGIDYELSLFGFSQDGGANITSGFNIPEGDIQTAALYGSISQVSVVPVPAGLPLILTGLAALGFARRSKKPGEEMA